MTARPRAAARAASPCCSRRSAVARATAAASGSRGGRRRAAQRRARRSSTTSRWTCCRRCAAPGPCARGARRTRTRSSSTRCAASRGRAPSPGSTPTRPACAPTSPTRPTRRTRAVATPAFARFGNRERTVAVAAARVGLHDGVCQASTSTSTSTSPAVPCRPRRPVGRPARRLRLRLRRLGVLQHPDPSTGSRSLRYHPAPPTGASAEAKDAHLRRGRHRRDALAFIDAPRDDAAPYFLQVAPYAPHSRVNPLPHYPGDPLFPPAFRDRPGQTQPGGDCGAVALRRAHRAQSTRASPNPQRDNRPRRRDGRVAPRVYPAPGGLSATTAVRRAAQPGPDGAVGRPDGQPDPGRRRPRHLRHPHLGQRLPPRPAGARARHRAAYTTDTQVPLLVVGPGVVPGPRREMVSNLDLAPTLEALAGLASAGVPLRGVVRPQPEGPVGPAGKRLRLPGAHPDPLRAPPTPTGCPSSTGSRRTSRCAAAPVC